MPRTRTGGRQVSGNRQARRFWHENGDLFVEYEDGQVWRYTGATLTDIEIVSKPIASVEEFTLRLEPEAGK